MQPFTESEKARIRHHLGYPSWSSMTNGIQLGFPSGAQPLFLLEQSFNKILPDGMTEVRKDLCECEAIEKQLSSARARLKSSQLGKLVMNPQERADLRQELQFWQQRLADDLGVTTNPYSSMSYNGMGGGRNATVQS